MKDEDIKSNIKTSMDVLTDGINAETQQQLNQIRLAALESRQKSMKAIWSMAGAFAAVALMVLLIINDKQQDIHLPENNLAMLEDLELLAGEVDTDFYQDIEFLNWLDDNNLLETGI